MTDPTGQATPPVGVKVPAQPATPGGPLDDINAAIARINQRLDALEAAEAAIGSEPRPSEEEIARLAWAVKHGRQRPW